MRCGGWVPAEHLKDFDVFLSPNRHGAPLIERIGMRALQPNPETGFLESVNPATTEAFDSAKKVRFLQLARQCADERQLPDIPKLCDAVGTKYNTFMEHLQNDEVFRNAWNDVKARLSFGFANELSIKAKSKNGIIANLAVLKYLESGSWRDDQKVIFNGDNSSIKAIMSSAKQVLDAEIVESPQITSSQDQVHEK